MENVARHRQPFITACVSSGICAESTVGVQSAWQASSQAGRQASKPYHQNRYSREVLNNSDIRYEVVRVRAGVLSTKANRQARATNTRARVTIIRCDGMCGSVCVCVCALD